MAKEKKVKEKEVNNHPNRIGIKEAAGYTIAEAGNMAWNNDLSMWKQHGVDLKKPNTMSQLMVAFRKQTLDELKNAYSEAVKIARMASTFNKKVNDFKDESRNEFLKIAQAKTKNKDRLWHFLSNIKNRSPLGTFAFSRQEYIPESIGNNPRDPRTGFDIVSVLGRELDSRKYKMATDSLEYKELTEFMNQYGLAQDSALTSYFEDIEIY